MDQALPYNTAVLQTLLKTNRPPTDEERAIIKESMAPATAELETVKEQISEAMTHIQALKSQLKQAEIQGFRCIPLAEIGLERLREKEATILESTAYHRGVISPFRDLPEDILREICHAFVESDISMLACPHIASTPPAPYQLMHISSGIRHIVLQIPSIWASINFQIDSSSNRVDAQKFTTFLCEARKWLQRAGGLALSINVLDLAYGNGGPSGINLGFNAANTLFDFLLTYSTRWKSIRFNCPRTPTLLTRIAALSTVDVPQLQSISLLFQCGHSTFSRSPFLSVPTLKYLALEGPSIKASDFTVNWAFLTSLTLNGYFCRLGRNLSAREITKILQQTKCLTFCEISVEYDRDHNLALDYPSNINLPFLKVFHLNDKLRSMEKLSILDVINAPVLQTFKFIGWILEATISSFFKKSPGIQDIFLHQMFNELSLMLLAKLLRFCPSLIALSLTHRQDIRNMGQPLDANRFLQMLVQADHIMTYPSLQYFTFNGAITVSLPTLQQFLEGKPRDIAIRKSICAWKRVTIDLDGIVDKHVRKQMLDLFSQKLEEGISVGVPRKETA